MSLRVSEDEYQILLTRYGRERANEIREREEKRSKYNNKRLTLDDEHFDSIAEARRWVELRALFRAGKINCLRRQVPYEIVVAGMPICKYVADFVYMEDGKEVVEDVKGVRTPVYRLKRKLVEAVHGIRVKEVTMRKR